MAQIEISTCCRVTCPSQNEHYTAGGDENADRFETPAISLSHSVTQLPLLPVRIDVTSINWTLFRDSGAHLLKLSHSSTTKLTEAAQTTPSIVKRS